MNNESEWRVVCVTIEGGIVQDVVVPEGVKVIVKDYDVEFIADDELETDDDGQDYMERVWEGGGNA